MAATNAKLMMKERREAAKRMKEIEKRKICDEKEKLISEIEKRPAIWDRSQQAYRQKVVDDMWSEVSFSMGKDSKLWLFKKLKLFLLGNKWQTNEHGA